MFNMREHVVVYAEPMPRVIQRILGTNRYTLLFAVVVGSLLSTTAVPAAAGLQAALLQKSKEPTENALTKEVRHQLAVLPYLSVFDHIDFKLDGSKVTLSGQVLRPNLKHDAAASVQSIEGIGRVDNQIEVLPRSDSDDQMRRAIYRAIFEDPVLQKYAVTPLPSIRIIVKNGSTTLEGSVESEADGKLATIRAATVAKLNEVKDNLVVRGKGGSGTGGK